MSRVRLVHAAATVLNGLMITAVLLGRDRLAMLLIGLSLLLLVWSLDQLRDAIVKEPRP